MSDAVSNVTIKIGSTGDFAAFTAARAQADALRASVGGLKDVLGTFGVGLSAAGLIELGSKAIETMASIQRLSEQAGISTTAFQAMSLVAVEAGMDHTALAQSLEFLRKSMGMAEDGASKQTKAIRELGLNTADLLAMPAEEQFSAIAKAYVTSSDKGKAWADVIVLLGRNSAHLQQVLEEYGTKGAAAIEKVNMGWIISEADLARVDRFKVKLEGLPEKILAVALALQHMHLGSSAEDFGKDRADDDKTDHTQAPAGATVRSFTEGMEADAQAPKKSPADDAAAAKAASTAKADAIRTEMAATLQALPAMIEAHAALTKALEDEAGAYQTNSQKAARFRGEAAEAEAKSKTDSADPADFTAMVQSVKDQTEASKLRLEADKLDATTQKELFALAQKQAIFDGKGLSEAQQLAANKAALLIQQGKLNQLDEDAEDAPEKQLAINKEILRLKEAIRVEEEKTGEAELRTLGIQDRIAEKTRNMAELAVARDWNLTDNEKWQHKVALMQLAVEQLQKQEAAYDAIAADEAKPEGERAGAKKASEATAEKVQQAKTALADVGPNPDSFTQNFQADITKLRSSWGSLQQQMASGLTGVISSGLGSVETNIDKVISKTETWRRGLLNIGLSIETSVVQSFVKMATQWVASQIMMAVSGKAIAATSAAANVPIAAAESAVWATPATLATIASFGGAAVQAPPAIMAAMAATQGLALFEKGGSLGDGYGLAEPGEFVFSAPAVRNIGEDKLDAAHQAARSGWHAPASGGGGNGGSRGKEQPIHIHQHQSHTDALRAALKTRDGRSLVHDISTGAVKEYRR